MSVTPGSADHENQQVTAPNRVSGVGAENSVAPLSCAFAGAAGSQRGGQRTVGLASNDPNWSKAPNTAL
jgi:hypothetical protein